MRLRASLVVALLVCAGSLGTARAELPKTLDEMKVRHAEQGKTPEGATKLWLDACFVYMNPDTRDEGRKMIAWLTYPFHRDNLDDWDTKPAGRLLASRLQAKEYQHIFRSYAKGTSPDNQYKMDPNNWELNHVRNFQHPGDARGIQCYLDSTGADADRPAYLKQAKDGLWYMNIYANLISDIRPPKKEGGFE